MAKARIGKNLARFAVIVFVDQNPARQDSERAFDNAHVLIEYQMMDIRTIEQRADSRNQDDIVGANQFPQFWCSVVGPATLHEPFRSLRTLAALRRTFYCYSSS
jgi:hypothetical protein